MVEATGLGLFLYRPVAWCFLRGMKKSKIMLVASIVVVAVLIKTQTNLRTKIDYYEDGSKELANPFAQIVKALLRFSLVRSSNSNL